LLSLREGLEAALIIGIVLGALQKIRRTDLAPALWMGTLAALGVSILTAVILTLFGLSLEDGAEQIYEGITMLLAAGILTWMIFWMSGQAKNIKTELEDGINKAVATTGKRAVFGLAFLAVVREGVELALFITAAFFAGNSENVTTNIILTLTGVVLGLGTAVLLGWSLLAATARLNLRRFFQITGYLLILFAAGLVAHGIHEFNEVGWIPSIIEHVWDVNAVVIETSVVGELLKTLFGYNGNPSLTEVIGYFVYLAVAVFFFTRTTTTQPVAKKNPVQSPA
ncbi:MAG TPA: FTR1 family protein, partial [Anaerolineales bacterium]|nr:FTR1 family protein [Anaerolineales bacterium]